MQFYLMGVAMTVVTNAMATCGNCERNVMNLEEHVRDALADLPFDFQLDVQVGLCDSCPLS